MADSTKKPAPTPDDSLAARIADGIAKDSLVGEQKITWLREGLAKGTLTASDWKLLAELATPDKGGDSI